jgi:hypothetical protein
MNTLWIFGDSFSEYYRLPKKIDGAMDTNDWRYQYLKWKDKPSVKVYGEIIAEKLNLKLVNKGYGGVCNSHIFEEYCKVCHKIGENDIVIFGWTDQSRFRLVNMYNTWTSLTPSDLEKDVKGLKLISKDTISETLLNRTNISFLIELRNWIKLINLTLSGKTVVHWTWSKVITGSMLKAGNYEVIREETNNEVKDAHWSEKGQMDFANFLIEKINEGGTNLNQELPLF